MNSLFKVDFSSLKTYEDEETVISMFEDVLDVIENKNVITYEEYEIIGEALGELADQYWHNYPDEINESVKKRLEDWINKHFSDFLEYGLMIIYTLKLEGCYTNIEEYIEINSWNSNVEKHMFVEEHKACILEKEFPWNTRKQDKGQPQPPAPSMATARR